MTIYSSTTSSWKHFPGPNDVTREVLENGITLLTRSNFEAQSVVVSGYLASGSLFDPADQCGLAHFTAQSLTSGTQTRSFQQIYNSLESIGASLGFDASVHNASFSGRCLAEDLPIILDILSECLMHPTFPNEQVEKLRGRILAGLAIRAQDTAQMASLTFDERLFPAHPYGKPEEGFPETITKITIQDLINFQRQHYGPKGMVIVIVGAITAQQAHDLTEKALGAWKNPAQHEAPGLPQIKPPAGITREHITIPGKVQADLVMGTLAPKRTSDDFLPASLGNSILGQFGMMGRIGDVVREQAGLAYYASTSLNAWRDSGSWEVAAGVNPANLDKAIELIISELRRYVSEPVTQEELSDSQSYFIGRLPLSLESNMGVASALLNIERFNLGLDYYQRYPNLVQQITPEGILSVSQRYINPDNLIIVSAG